MQKETPKQFLIAGIIAVFIISLGVFYANKNGFNLNKTIFSKKTENASVMKKEVVDSKGCITSRGYIWDAKNKKCVNPWEGVTKEQMVAGANPFAKRCIEDGGTSKEMKDKNSGKTLRYCVFKGIGCEEKLYFSGACFK